MSKIRVCGSASIKIVDIGLGGIMDMSLTIASSENIFNVGCLSGEWEKIEFGIFVLKGPDYNI